MNFGSFSTLLTQLLLKRAFLLAKKMPPSLLTVSIERHEWWHPGHHFDYNRFDVSIVGNQLEVMARPSGLFAVNSLRLEHLELFFWWEDIFLSFSMHIAYNIASFKIQKLESLFSRKRQASQYVLEDRCLNSWMSINPINPFTDAQCLKTQHLNRFI